MSWQPIETAPRDGTPVMVRRVSADGLNLFGDLLAVFDFFAPEAPMRQPLPADLLGRTVDNEGEAAYQREVLANRQWLSPDRMKRVPEPTHYLTPPSPVVPATAHEKE